MPISEQEFKLICSDIKRDRTSITKHNPIGSDEEILLWMLLSCLNSFLSLSEMEMPCFTGRPDARTYRDAVLYVVRGHMAPPFDAEAYLAKMLDE